MRLAGSDADAMAGLTIDVGVELARERGRASIFYDGIMRIAEALIARLAPHLGAFGGLFFHRALVRLGRRKPREHGDDD